MSNGRVTRTLRRLTSSPPAASPALIQLAAPFNASSFLVVEACVWLLVTAGGGGGALMLEKRLLSVMDWGCSPLVAHWL